MSICHPALLTILASGLHALRSSHCSLVIAGEEIKNNTTYKNIFEYESNHAALYTEAYAAFAACQKHDTQNELATYKQTNKQTKQIKQPNKTKHNKTKQQTNKNTNKQANEERNKQTQTHTHKQTNNRKNKQPTNQPTKQTNKQTNKQKTS